MTILYILRRKMTDVEIGCYCSFLYSSALILIVWTWISNFICLHISLIKQISAVISFSSYSVTGKIGRILKGRSLSSILLFYNFYHVLKIIMELVKRRTLS